MTIHLSRFRTFYLLLGLSWLGADAQALTLAEALSSASRHNEEVRIAAARVARARAVRRDAVAALLPAATVHYNYTRRGAEITRIVNDERVVLTPLESRAADLTVDLTLFDFANLPRVQSTHADLRAERFDSVTVHRDLSFEVAGTFFEALAAERQAQAARIRQQVAEQFVRDTRDKVGAGLANRNELTRLELELASAQLVRTQTENAMIQARLLLGFLIGQEVQDTLTEPAELTTDEIRAGEEAREEQRPEFQASLYRAAAARARAREPWLSWLPDLGLRFIRYAPEDLVDGSSSGEWQVNGTLSWDLFQPRLFARAGLQGAESRIARESTRALRRRLALDSRTAQTNVESAQAALDQADVQQRVAEQNAEEVRERFRLGLATALEQADANVAEFEARAALARQRFALQQAQLDRLRADGYGPEAILTDNP